MKMINRLHWTTTIQLCAIFQLNGVELWIILCFVACIRLDFGAANYFNVQYDKKNECEKLLHVEEICRIKLGERAKMSNVLPLFLNRFLIFKTSHYGLLFGDVPSANLFCAFGRSLSICYYCNPTMRVRNGNFSHLKCR